MDILFILNKTKQKGYYTMCIENVTLSMLENTFAPPFKISNKTLLLEPWLHSIKRIKFDFKCGFLDSVFGKFRTIFYLSILYAIGQSILAFGAVSDSEYGIEGLPNL